MTRGKYRSAICPTAEPEPAGGVAATAEPSRSIRGVSEMPLSDRSHGASGRRGNQRQDRPHGGRPPVRFGSSAYDAGRSAGGLGIDPLYELVRGRVLRKAGQTGCGGLAGVGKPAPVQL